MSAVETEAVPLPNKLEYTPSDIAQATNRPVQSITRLCRRMEKRRHLSKCGGRWRFDYALAIKVLNQARSEKGVQ